MPIAPNQVTPVYCSDERLAIKAADDFSVLCPPGQVMASGSDGVFASGFPWVMTSAVNFTTQGIGVDPYGAPFAHVIQLVGPASQFKGSGILMGIASVAGTSLTLRQIGTLVSGVGQPPVPSTGLTGVSFRIATLFPQIELATHEINQRWRIDANVGGRHPTDLYDLRDLELATILTVLKMRYGSATRTDRGDFRQKLDAANQELGEVQGRLNIRYGQSGVDLRTSTWFSMRGER